VVDPDVQVVICSAYSDYAWAELLAQLGNSDKLIVVGKPFEPIDILQCARDIVRQFAGTHGIRFEDEAAKHTSRRERRLNDDPKARPPLP
jgi:hypothetical protein